MKRFVTYLPLNDNDGNAFPQSVIDGIIEDLYTIFGGCTVGSVGTGYWKDGETLYVDKNISVTVAIDENSIELAKTKVIEYGNLLGQEAMYFELIDSNIEFLK
tara:strand:- start:108 stop:416 length:309 start_codon:yes stop_codon:yes gene_type:complete